MSGIVHGDERQVQEQAILLIRPLISPDAEERVRRTVKQFNQVVREHIRSETGLKLSDEMVRGTVPVTVVDGFPSSVAWLIDQHHDPTLWRLIIAQPGLVAMKDGLNMLLRDWDEYERWPKLTGVAEGSRPALETAAQVADALMRVAAAREVFEDIRKIDEDMLGAYCFGWSPQIEIYWMAHALFAGAFGLRMEDLSVVTLAHELAHAYIHIGRDIDGRTWVEPGFGESDRGVIEGLAQFYACVIAEKLRVRAPGVYEAYERLLEHQSGPYLAHTEWLKTERRNRGEAMRFALLCARTVGTTSKQAWHGMLEQARRQLREP